MRTKASWLRLVPVLLLGACSSSGATAAAGGAQDAAPAGEPTVELTVINRADGTAIVFAEWAQGRRTRLGTLRAGATATYTTPHRGTSLRLGVESSAPPPVTTNVRVAAESPTVAVDAGDRLVFEITRLNPVSVFYRRAEP
ncbi:MAG: hypothetical protein FJ207_00355 [Gemmatimonadetes bacterium]|nr:hypothetical protein [Gemmatimonadota bacterium]